MTHKIIGVKNNDLSETIQEFLKTLLKEKKVHALLVMQQVPSKKLLFPVLVTDHRKLHIDVFAPVHPVSVAAVVSKLTKVQPSKQRIGVVMRPCDIRALIELVKLNQANLENIVIIGVDCLGTFPINTYVNLLEKQKPTHLLLDGFHKKSNEAETYLRTSCRVCKDPVPLNADLVIGIYGVNTAAEIVVEPHTDLGRQMLDGLNLEAVKDGKEREKTVKHLRDEQSKKYHTFVQEKEKHMKGIEKLATFYETCVNCHNCRKACPICYCKECVFDSSLFDSEAYKFVKKADAKGMYKIPSDTLLFHLGRMNHMIVSCVQCGLCEQACPNLIPLMDILIPVGEHAQKTFEYKPGHDPKDKIPMIVYREDEFTKVGEA